MSRAGRGKPSAAARKRVSPAANPEIEGERQGGAASASLLASPVNEGMYIAGEQWWPLMKHGFEPNVGYFVEYATDAVVNRCGVVIRSPR